MDLLTLGFLVLIVLASGGIAVFADWLGRRLGKKRLTIFKLRPKTTAQLGTFLSGLIISSVTIGLVSVFSSDVRMWIKEGRRAIVEVEALRQESKGLIKDKSALTADVHDLTTKRDQARTNAAKYQKLANQQRQQVSEQAAKILRQQALVRQLRARATSLTKQYKDLKDSYSHLTVSLAQAEKTLGGVRKTLSKAKADLTTTRNTMAEAVSQKNELATRSVELENEVARLERGRDALQREIEDIKAEQARVEREATEARDKLDLTRGQLISADVELAKRKADLATAEDKLRAVQEALSVSLTASRTQRLCFSMGEELGRVSIPAYVTQADGLNLIRNLERSCRIVALERGAKQRGQDYPAAGIFQRVDASTNKVYSADDLRQQLAERIAEKPYPQVMLAYASLNSFSSEPVSLEVAISPNPVAFAADEVIGEAPIDGRQSASAIFKAVNAFLDTKIRQSPRLKNLLPKHGEPEPIISVSSQDLLQLVDHIVEQNRLVRVQALSAGETHAGDTLKLQFRLR